MAKESVWPNTHLGLWLNDDSDDDDYDCKILAEGHEIYTVILIHPVRTVSQV